MFTIFMQYNVSVCFQYGGALMLPVLKCAVQHTCTE